MNEKSPQRHLSHCSHVRRYRGRRYGDGYLCARVQSCQIRCDMMHNRRSGYRLIAPHLMRSVLNFIRISKK